MSPEHRSKLSNRAAKSVSRARWLTLLAGAGAIVLWGCNGGGLEPVPPIGVVGGASGAAGSPAPHVPGPCLEPAADAALARFQAGVVGSWLGTAIAPQWSWTHATVEFTFFCDGHYHSRCLFAEGGYDPANCVATYWGTDDDTPEKTYEIYDVRSDGKATANIVLFPGTTTSTTLVKLEAIDLTAAADQLAFDLIDSGRYGPVQYDLHRVP